MFLLSQFVYMSDMLVHVPFEIGSRKLLCARSKSNVNLANRPVKRTLNLIINRCNVFRRSMFCVRNYDDACIEFYSAFSDNNVYTRVSYLWNFDYAFMGTYVSYTLVKWNGCRVNQTRLAERRFGAKRL